MSVSSNRAPDAERTGPIAISLPSELVPQTDERIRLEKTRSRYKCEWFGRHHNKAAKAWKELCDKQNAGRCFKARVEVEPPEEVDVGLPHAFGAA